MLRGRGLGVGVGGEVLRVGEGVRMNRGGIEKGAKKVGRDGRGGYQEG